ncbi:MAG: amidase [Geminicoccaceae bacterium]|nr:amidase [Geminicoccaceae bacterium]
MPAPKDHDDLARLGAAEARALLVDGRLSALELTEACLARIAAREETVRAFAFLDPDHARRQAEALDALRRAGRPLRPLHGLPVAVKDVFDTGDMPTCHGTPLHEGRRPRRDAFVVGRLRAAGAVILGKSVTTELAVYAPGPTRNPHDPGRTPGGSSSGSAAAVADFMAPLALGTQTNGSVIRPAAFCGVVGVKPSFGLVGRSGVLRQSPPLDQVGVFARSVRDAALLLDAIVGFDPGDRDSLPWAAPGFERTLDAPWPIEPDLALVPTPRWDEAGADLQGGLAEIVQALGGAVPALDLKDALERVWDLHRTVMEADLAASYAADYARGGDALSPVLRAMLERGRTLPAVAYIEARDAIPRLRAAIEPLFDRFDAFLTPASPGAAPRGLDSTGSPAFCTPWTYLGLPALTLPLLKDGDGLPIGVQLVGRHGDDARLLRTAARLVRRLEAAPPQASETP